MIGISRNATYMASFQFCGIFPNVWQLLTACHGAIFLKLFGVWWIAPFICLRQAEMLLHIVVAGVIPPVAFSSIVVCLDKDFSATGKSIVADV